jgi:hypothetical protein
MVLKQGDDIEEQKWKLYRRQLEAALVVFQRISGFISILSGLKNNFKGFKKTLMGAAKFCGICPPPVSPIH